MQRRFVHEYLQSRNLKEAAQKVGIKDERYHCFSTMRQSVREVIRAYVETFLVEQKMTTQKVLSHLVAIADSRIGDYYDKDGKINLQALQDPELGIAVQSLEQEDGKVKLKLHPKMDAIKHLTTLLRLVGPKQVEISGPDGGAIPVQIEKDQVIADIKRVIDSVAEEVRE